MIDIIRLDELLSAMVTDITAAEAAGNPLEKPVQVAGHILVVNEKHMVKKLADKSGVWIAVTFPSADPATENEDAVAENNIVWMFVVEKTDPGKYTESEELQHYRQLQEVTAAVKNWLRDRKLDGNQWLEYLDLRTLHTDPEYQFGGWNGWSLNFSFETGGY